MVFAAYASTVGMRAFGRSEYAGLEPHYLGPELVHSMLETIERHKGRVIERAILPKTRWKPGELEAATLSPTSAA